ncbi:hypothetical protein [Marinitenerispora sediminis]|uniref:hypothetical protein n=1 Tax=Marinitenerispora sediminis TaxID=1931232 RepID=UPI0015F144CB|nr:hypothetical protein [Marinitenerispora sediminis]
MVRAPCTCERWEVALVANAWMPGAGRVRRATPGSALYGGAPRAVWQTTESDPGALSARAVAQRLASDGRNAHLVWNPLSGEVVQLLPATVAAAGQLGCSDAVDRAREGRACLLVLVVGRASHPVTDGRMAGLAAILEWLDSWGVERRWPAGPPPEAASAYGSAGSVRAWAQGGHFGHSQVPASRAVGPGAVDVRRMLGMEIPAQRTIPQAPRAPEPPEGDSDPTGNGTRPHAATAS